MKRTFRKGRPRKDLPQDEENGHAPKRMQLPEKFSESQEAVIEEMATGKGHLICWAGPGSGKTTTLVGGLARGVPGKPQVTAFGRSTKADFRAAVPEDKADVNTIHSIALRAVKQRFPRIELDPDGDSLAEHTLRSYPGWQSGGPTQQELARAVTLLALCKAQLCPASEAAVRRCDDAAGSAPGLLELGPRRFLGSDAAPEDAAGADLDDAMAASAAVHAAVAHALRLVGADRKVDFNDLIYIMALDKTVQPWPRDVVIIDEAQDITPAQERCVLKMVSATGRLIAVGDPNQAIFGFAGADGLSLDRLAKLPTAKVLLLGESFRCPQRVIEYVRSTIPGAHYLKAVPSAPVGDVRTVSPSDAILAISQRLKRPRAQRSSMIVSRSYAAMKPLWTRMAQHYPVAILGEQFTAFLEAFIARNNRGTIKGGVWQKKTWWGRLMWRAPNIAMLLEPWYASYESPLHVLDRARAICQPAVLPDVVTFATAHKAKGLEAQQVLLLESSFKQEESREEQNVYYVAATRAKDTLLLVED